MFRTKDFETDFTGKHEFLFHFSEFKPSLLSSFLFPVYVNNLVGKPERKITSGQKSKKELPERTPSAWPSLFRRTVSPTIHKGTQFLTFSVIIYFDNFGDNLDFRGSLKPNTSAQSIFSALYYLMQPTIGGDAIVRSIILYS